MTIRTNRKIKSYMSYHLTRLPVLQNDAVQPVLRWYGSHIPYCAHCTDIHLSCISHTCSRGSTDNMSSFHNHTPSDRLGAMLEERTVSEAVPLTSNRELSSSANQHQHLPTPHTRPDTAMAIVPPTSKASSFPPGSHFTDVGAMSHAASEVHMAEMLSPLYKHPADGCPPADASSGVQHLLLFLDVRSTIFRSSCRSSIVHVLDRTCFKCGRDACFMNLAHF